MQQRVDKMSRKTVSGIVLLILLASFLSIRIKTTQASDATSCIIDDTNDWIGGTGLDFMDITSACIVNVDYFTVRFEMSVANNIPEDPSPMFIGYVWALDLDQDGIFNEFPPYAPDYTDLNVRVAFDPDPTHGAVFGWHGFIDGKYCPQILYESFSIIANTVLFTLSLSEIYDPTPFLWQAGTIGSIEGTNLPSDIAPNYGLPRASWSRTPVISATIDINPDALNLESMGRWITAYIEFSEGYNVADIDASTILLNDTIPAELHPTEIGDYDTDGALYLMVKFDRQEVIALLGAGEATLTITGEVNGIPFEGSATIRVIDK